ncbi:MAG: SCO family protein [Burkholderiaceae bacterium]
MFQNRRTSMRRGDAAKAGSRAARPLVALLALSAAWCASAEQGGAGHRHVAPEIVRTLANYSLPNVSLVRDDGRRVTLRDEVDDGRPVVVSFVYTTCTTICPLTSMTLAELQRRLDAEHARVHLMSISIDPEEDTPARLRDYARKFGAGSQWQHYTGTVAASVASQRAFDVYRGDKMSHAPVVVLRSRPGGPWIRFEGFVTADQLLADLRPAVATQ